MFWKITLSQVNYLLRKKEAIFTFCILFCMVIFNFLGNVIAFQGMDIVEMYHPMKLMLLSYNRTNYNATNTLFLIQIYPFLVAFPAGFSLAKEYQIGEDVYLCARVGNHTYKKSKFMTAFLTTTIVFTIPFLMEFILNCFSFPLNATGDLTNWSCYDQNYQQWVENYFMSELYFINPYLYAFVGILLFGTISGLLGTLVVIISSFFKIKYNVFLFLPPVLLLNLSNMLTTESSSFSLRWYDYLLLFNENKTNSLFFCSVLLGFVVFTLIGLWISKRKDCL